MKNQYLVVFIASVFLVACTTTSKSNNYSYTETGRWIASAEENANAKMSAMIFLADQAVSSCEAVQKVLSKIQEQRSRNNVRDQKGQVVINLKDIKEALIEVDVEGIVSLTQNPDCKNKIYALAQVISCSGTAGEGVPFCEAVKLRREIDQYTLRLQTADSATAQRIKEELSEKIEELETKYKSRDEQQHSEGKVIGGIMGLSITAFGTLVGLEGSAAAVLGGAAGATAAATAIGATVAVLGIVLVFEGAILITSLAHALDTCGDTNIDRCRRQHFARAHKNIWSGIAQLPAAAIGGMVSVFRKIF